MDTFTTFPRDPGDARTRPLTRPLDDMRLTEEGGRLVVVIDDSPVICRIVEYSLRSYGITTVSFHSGIAAIKALNDGTTPIPDLIVLDIGMPHMNGYDVASLLSKKEQLRLVPIVMLSGHDGLFDRIRAWRVGANEFISKPFKKPDLIRKIFSLLALDLPDDIAESQS